MSGFDGLDIPPEIWSTTSDFIYFSHKFITIPTSSWIETCHKNRTRCLGTLITEWDQGIEFDFQKQYRDSDSVVSPSKGTQEMKCFPYLIQN